MQIRLLLILFLISSFSFAQKFKDTVYYYEYNSSIIAAFEAEVKGNDITITQNHSRDTANRSKIHYRTNANSSYGFAFAFDKIGFSFGFSIPQKPAEEKQRGVTKYMTFGLNVGGNKWILEANYKNYKGFYDPDRLDSASKTYYQNPGLQSTLYKLKFLYFANHKKFAFKNCYSNSYRQIKSAFSFVITANAYYSQLNSDSLIPFRAINYYKDYADLKGLDVFGFSIYAGASLNLVIWKHIMLNATWLIGPEDQYRTYKFIRQPTRNLNYISYSQDLRGAIGLNYSKFFTFASVNYDITDYKSAGGSSKLPGVEIAYNYWSVYFTLGFRIHTKYPKFYQKIQATKLYQML